MTRQTLVALILLAGALTACEQTRTYINSGNAEGVEIGYAGDPATTLPLAREHCAQFEKVPQLATAGDNIAVYQCIAH